MFKTETFKKLFAIVSLFSCLVSTSVAGGRPDSLQYWHGQKRTLQYRPDGQDFVTVNGKNKFTRALYGTETDFRVETSDVPEFGLYLPRMGGNIHFGLIRGNQSIWMNDCDYVESRYRPGTRLYKIKDSLLENGTIEIQALALSKAEGIVIQMKFTDVPENLELVTVYGGAANKRFHRSGDLGVDPQNSFELQTDYCKNNVYSISDNAFKVFYGASKAENLAVAEGQALEKVKVIAGILPREASLREGDAEARKTTPPGAWNAKASEEYPLLLARQKVASDDVLYCSFYKPSTTNEMDYADMPGIFSEAENTRAKLASRIQIDTPDPWINTLGGVLAVAGDGIWESPVYQHGSVGWRMPLSGWRGAYVADVLGWHDRARTHFDAYANSQVTDVPPQYPHPNQDSELNLARALKKWGTQMFSNGYICRNPNRNDQMHHYDMNLCYIDELLWHFNWTGDLDYVKKMWPVIEAHLKWEKRNYDPDDDGLYDAYACIWASDALQYNSGAVTHSSAYNYRANKMAAQLAEMIGKDPEPYRQEAGKIRKALASELWLDNLGWWAEYKDFMGHQRIHPNAAVWTIYHAIDSDIDDVFHAYQATRYIDTEIPHIPVVTEGVDPNLATIATTNWMPYSWSINNVAFAEVNHTALAYWQAGRPEQAFRLLKSSVLDGMYMGDSPGNIGQISFYDAARGECYRDFADPVGITSRAVIQGLFGILPDALNKRVIIRPGFPVAWEHASLKTPDLEFSYRQSGMTDTYLLVPGFPVRLEPELHLQARYSNVKAVLINGKQANWQNDTDAVGRPGIIIKCPLSEQYAIKIEWAGHLVDNALVKKTVASGDPLKINIGQPINEVYDPQHVLSGIITSKQIVKGIVAGQAGQRTLFVKITDGDLTWWHPLHIQVKTPVAVENVDPESDRLKLRVVNNSNTTFKGRLSVNPGKSSFEMPLSLEGGISSEVIEVPDSFAAKGSNKVMVTSETSRIMVDTILVNWTITPSTEAKWVYIDLKDQFNDKVTNIFKNEYLTPRPPYTTLQIPTQGIGEWCHPLMTADIDDSGFRESIVQGVFHSPQDLPFKSEPDTSHSNIAFTSMWDNYPDSLSVPLEGKAAHAYLLMAGSTNPMQSRFVNGEVRIDYTDGSSERLDLINPDTWCPIEQDYYVDGAAFYIGTPRPYRVQLKTGLVSCDLGKELNIEGVEPRRIEGGAAEILDLPLDNRKKLKQLTLKTTANDVIIGLMGVTLRR
jgi:hypothetical protein